jgi:hypothetical protein
MWKDLIARSEAERTVICKQLDGKLLFTVMLRLYAAIHREIRGSVLPEQEESTEEFRQHRRRKRNPSEEQAKRSKTTIMPKPGMRFPRIQSQDELRTRNFFDP